VIRTPIGKQRLECLTLRRGFHQQSTEQGVQAVAIKPWLQREESPESVNISRADRHTVDPQGDEKAIEFHQLLLHAERHGCLTTAVRSLISGA
jgi:hypothetical protein